MKKIMTIVASLLLAACGTNNSGTVSYTTLNYSEAVAGSSTILTGIRGVGNASTTDKSANAYVSGFYTASTGGTNIGLLYDGSLAGTGTWYTLNFPSSTGVTVTGTALYGPNNSDVDGDVQIVGNYTTSEAGETALGLLYDGPVDGSGTWSTLNPQSLAPARTIINTIAHSVMNGYVVGNFDTDLATGRAFIYDIAHDSYIELAKPNAVSTTAYGIWYNGGTSYTFVGGYSDVNTGGLDTAYAVDWDSETQALSNWTTYSYNNQSTNTTHFEGITTDGNGGYNVVADWDNGSTGGASFVNIVRNSAGTFGHATWTNYAFPGASLTSANTVFLNYALGVYRVNGIDVTNGYVTTF